MKNVKLILILLIASQFLMSGKLSSTKNSSENIVKLSENDNGKYLLRLNPEVGKSGKMVMTLNMVIDMEMMGQSMSTTQKMEMASDMKIVSNTDEKVVTSMKYDYFAMSMEAPMMGSMTYDTRKDDNEGMMVEALEASFGELLESEITIEQSHDGTTLKTTGLEDESQLTTGQSNMDISSMMNMSQFPEKAIKIGDSWNKKIQGGSSPMTFDATYTLKKVEEGKVYVDLVSKVTMSEIQDEEGGSVSTEMTGIQTGTFIYEQATMWLLEGIINQDFDMEVEQMGMKIPMKLKSDIIMVVE
ncbi:MAG: DUF6263 family protein [Chitinophagales bacterium]